MKTNIVIGNNFNTNTISGKTLGLQLWDQMLSASKIVGFFKM